MPTFLFKRRADEGQDQDQDKIAKAQQEEQARRNAAGRAGDYILSRNLPQPPTERPQPMPKDEEEAWSRSYYGGGKNLKLKPTEKRRKVGKQTRVVYVGPRGGQYVKMQGRFVNVKEL